MRYTASSDYDSNFCYFERVDGQVTVTFKKKCSGFFGAAGTTMSGTATYAAIPNASGTYTDALYSFSAQSGQTLIFSSGTWAGMEIIGS